MAPEAWPDRAVTQARQSPERVQLAMSPAAMPPEVRPGQGGREPPALVLQAKATERRLAQEARRVHQPPVLVLLAKALEARLGHGARRFHQPPVLQAKALEARPGQEARRAHHLPRVPLEVRLGQEVRRTRRLTQQVHLEVRPGQDARQACQPLRLARQAAPPELRQGRRVRRTHRPPGPLQAPSLVGRRRRGCRAPRRVH
mmetsp:Transcript_29723/g.67384  ORF Transcript_29723/g.67384 Transcript_29723/m.67384 type:complete len:201 (+) Transcript_29723:300-902(+)